MSRNTKKLAFFLAALVAGSSVAMAGCGPFNPGSGDSGTITKLYIGNYNGGFGNDWLKKVEARFEEKYKEYSFEDGKVGVDVEIENSKNAGTGFLETLENEACDVYFTEDASYFDAARRGKFYPITDIVKETLTDYGEGKSIFEKLTKVQQDYYSVDGEIYALPHYTNFSGITYDIEMFEVNGYYRTIDGEFVNPKESDKQLSLGVNGKTGIIDGVDYSLDDGLPATYDELFELCAYMEDQVDGCFLWSGKEKIGYVNAFLRALYFDYEGKDNILRNVAFDGTASDLIDMDSIETNEYGKITNISFEEPLDINETNGYKLRQQAGRLYALSFLDQLISYGYHDNKCTESDDMLTAQYDYLKRSLNDSVAFFIDGIYWENEAQEAGSFTRLVNEKGQKASRENRRFGYMPLPKATKEKVGEKTTLVDGANSLAFLGATIDRNKVECAKKFLQFCYTDESLVEFSVTTNTPKGVLYTIPDEDFAKLSSYGKSIFYLINTQSLSEVVYPYSINAMYLNHQDDLRAGGEWSAKTLSPVAAILKGTSGADHFKSFVSEMTQDRWAATFL